jgi:hypothetical protein
MKRLMIVLAALAVMALPAVGGLLAAAPQASAATVRPSVAAGLRHMREEEKLARDVYLALDERYGDQVAAFANIARSEDRHTLAVRRLLTLYHVPDPVKTDVRGVFADPGLQKLYDELVMRGDASLEDALKVGVAIEKLDISDLKTLRSQTASRTIRRVYSNLLDGSYNHLSAFTRALTGQAF